MTMFISDDPVEFRRKAHALRAAAEGMIHQDSRRELLRMADAYESAAIRIEAQMADQNDPMRRS